MQDRGAGTVAVESSKVTNQGGLEHDEKNKGKLRLAMVSGDMMPKQKTVKFTDRQTGCHHN